jgi:uncharacterized iron-regulated membrane protein
MDRIFSFFSRMVRHQKNWYARWHAWAGIFAGSILLIVSLTGTLLVFEEELDVWLYPELFGFQTDGERLPFGDVVDKVKNDQPDWDVKGIYHFPKRNHAYVLNYGEDYRQAIVNPYSGKVMGTRVYQESVMGFIRHLHRTLLIPVAGKYIVGVASLVLVVLMITGLRLWIPKKWNKLKARLGVKRGASFKRQNYDWHNSLGFYFSPFITLIALTGAAITFSQFVILGLFLVSFEPPKSIESIIGQQSTYQAGKEPKAIDLVVEKANQEIPGGVVEGVTLPLDSVGTYGMNIIAPGAAKTGDVSLIYYDQYSGERLMSTHHDLAHMGKAYLNWVTPIHYGTFGGLVTRILALLASLVVPVLFITGFVIWWGRWKKRKKVSGASKYTKDDKGINGSSNQRLKLNHIKQ